VTVTESSPSAVWYANAGHVKLLYCAAFGRQRVFQARILVFA
jgi:hypothetical protein